MKTLLFGLTLLTGLGCMNAKPIGPLASRLEAPPKGDTTPQVTDTPDVVTVQAAKPVPPAKFINPEEVTADNHAVAAQKLLNEFDADRRSMPTASKTAEISRYKDGVKVK